MSETESEQYMWKIINISTDALSLLASLGLLSHFAQKKQIAYSLRYIQMIAVATLIQSIISIIFLLVFNEGSRTLQVLPYVLGGIAITANTASLLFSSVLGVFGFKIIKYLREFDQRSFYQRSVLYIFLASLLSGVCFSFKYTFAVTDPQWKTILSMIIISPPLIYSFFTCLMSSSQQIALKNDYFFTDFLKEMNVKVDKMFLYPIVMLIIYIPWAWTQILPERPEPIVKHVIYVFFNLLGVINVILYFRIKKLDATSQLEELSMEMTANFENNNHEITMERQREQFDSELRQIKDSVKNLSIV